MSYRLVFDTKHQYGSGQGIQVPVILGLRGQIVKLDAKVDTGAEYCVFQRGYGEHLGLEIEKGHEQRLATPTGSFQTFGHFLTIEVFGYPVDSMVYFAVDPDFKRNVLGRNGWLNRYRVAFIDHDSELYLSPYDA